MTAPGVQRAAFVIGGGLAGLSAATVLAARGVSVTLIEAAGQAGGRCRSYFDAGFDGIIDNGNHFILTGNQAAFGYLNRIGAAGAMQGSPVPEKDFFDLASGAHWTIRPNPGPFPLWLLDAKRRVPGTTPADYLELLKLLRARPGQRLGEVMSCKGLLWERLLHPFFLGALNTNPVDASAMLAGALVRKTFLRGGNTYRTRIAHPTLAAAFVDPAVAYLKSRGAEIRLGQRLRAITFGGGKAIALESVEGTLALKPDTMVVLAVPPWAAQDLVPNLQAPDDFRSIVNAHFKYPAPLGASPMLGVIGGTAEWIFTFSDRISVTISGADAIVDQDREELARRIWADVTRALNIQEPLPVWQIVKEKRATFAATPEQDARRPGAATRWNNLFLAGDWTQTGLPGTIEGAIQSGETAAALALKQLSL
ncbi:MAG TPA: hydroxysqualene dehydroxylase HpnE [Rhizomicrobium sp.]|nr:hydroxysqualene dehydroxylase HpnE [Rhizomicrobium sp.]